MLQCDTVLFYFASPFWDSADYKVFLGPCLTKDKMYWL